MQQVPYRPVIIASSVNPLRDLQQQAGSRAFLVSIPDATPEEEKEVRKAIRASRCMGAILQKDNNNQRDVLRAVSWVLQKEGIRDVLVPFDAEEPAGADRRGTGQFMKLIKVSAFINQFQRPVLELDDGRRFVLAVYEDLRIAAEVWFDFAGGQEFKISPKAIDILKELPDKEPGKTAPALAKDNSKGQRTVERYLDDLFDAGLVNRDRIQAPGSPWGYWCNDELRQKVLSKISGATDHCKNSDMNATETPCRKYMAKNSSDCLKTSIKELFSKSDIMKKDIIKGIIVGGILQIGDIEEIYLSIFSK
jgi:predicted transcriptional regulator